ncbi:hypothetical protein EAL2_c20970 [Peptoclostridium acidaminophilum DSM 3953]|uniref:Uncharacterized protein n=1 Tax=Peptoclostridium acidaminophilum DSM 3953 TaxID=1286171 RepID=W8THR0_PEPAC|nr:hypothetical protein [Peptoclostridium acidaminophilum]AHM57378.1 hypothetical protein EAL2_c20970 [Peptoclostridium acidaminophilum DSM 3953]
MKLLKVRKESEDRIKKFINTLKGYHMTLETKISEQHVYMRVYEYDVNRIMKVASNHRVKVLEV